MSTLKDVLKLRLEELQGTLSQVGHDEMAIEISKSKLLQLLVNLLSNICVKEDGFIEGSSAEAWNDKLMETTTDYLMELLEEHSLIR